MRKTKSVLEKTMFALGVDETRGIARDLVRKSEYQTGSRMVAYHNVGQMIGMSGMWVRKLVHGYGDVRLLHVTAMNIQEAYRRVCSCVDQAAENENAIAHAFERQLNDAAKGALELVDRAASANARAASMAARVSEDDED